MSEDKQMRPDGFLKGRPDGPLKRRPPRWRVPADNGEIQIMGNAFYELRDEHDRTLAWFVSEHDRDLAAVARNMLRINFDETIYVRTLLTKLIDFYNMPAQEFLARYGEAMTTRQLCDEIRDYLKSQQPESSQVD